MRKLIVVLMLGLIGCSNQDDGMGAEKVWKVRAYPYGPGVLRTFRHKATGACYVSNSVDGGIVEAPTAVCEEE